MATRPITLLALFLLTIFANVAIAQKVDCTKPDEYACEEDPFSLGSCNEQECTIDPYYPENPRSCDMYATASEFQNGVTTSSGIYPAGQNEAGNFLWNHGTVWCNRTKNCLAGTDCQLNVNGKFYCKADPNASWVYDNYLQYHPAGAACVGN